MCRAMLSILLMAGVVAAQGDLEVLTVLSNTYRMSCEMMASAAHNGINVHVVGWGDAGLTVRDFKNAKEQRLRQKIPLLYDYVKDWPPDTIIAFFDGGDVLWQGGTDDLLAGYHKVATKERPIVFSAERSCWIRSLPKWTCKLWPEVGGSQYKFLNSGMWMGPLSHVKPLLEYAISTLGNFDPATCDKCGDQAVFGKAYFSDGWNKSIALDHRCHVAQNLFGSQFDFKGCRGGAGVGGPRKKIRNCHTDSTPVLFHFNGDPKHPLLRPAEWLKRMWWHGKPLPASAVIRINGEETPLRDVCGSLTYAAAGEEGSTAPPDVLPRAAAGKTLLFDNDYLPSLSLDRPAPLRAKAARPASGRVVYSGAAPARSADSYFILMVAGIFFLAFVRHNIRRKGGLAR